MSERLDPGPVRALAAHMTTCAACAAPGLSCCAEGLALAGRAARRPLALEPSRREHPAPAEDDDIPF